MADPNYAPIYAHRTRRVKTDRRDAEALASGCQRSAVSTVQWVRLPVPRTADARPDPVVLRPEPGPREVRPSYAGPCGGIACQLTESNRNWMISAFEMSMKKAPTSGTTTNALADAPNF